MIRNLFFATIVAAFGLSLTPDIIIAQQPGDTLWTKTYGYSGSDEGIFVRQTDDLGYIITGLTGSSFNTDIWLLKTDQNGDTLWTGSYGGDGIEYGYYVQTTSDGGYIISGATQSFGSGPFDLYLVKTDEFGNTLWTRNYGTEDAEYGRSVQQTSDGGYIVGGYAYSGGPTLGDLYLLKTDSNGDSVWIKHYGGSSVETGLSLSAVSDGGYIFGATTASFGAGATDFWLLRLNQDGDTLWTRTYGGLLEETAFCVEQTSDGGYVIAGCSNSFGNGLFDVYVVRTDSIGDTLWTGIYGGYLDDYGEHICEAFGGGYIITGYTRSNSAGSTDLLVMKIDDDGNEVWYETYGGDDHDVGHAVRPATDEGYIITGCTRSFGAGWNDLWLLKIAKETTDIYSSSTIIPDDFLCLSNYPNPFNAATTITFTLPNESRTSLSVYDLLGRQVKTMPEEYRQAGVHTVNLDASDLSSGVYFYRLQAGGTIETKRMLLLK